MQVAILRAKRHSEIKGKGETTEQGPQGVEPQGAHTMAVSRYRRCPWVRAARRALKAPVRQTGRHLPNPALCPFPLSPLRPRPLILYPIPYPHVPAPSHCPVAPLVPYPPAPALLPQPPAPAPWPPTTRRAGPGLGARAGVLQAPL